MLRAVTTSLALYAVLMKLAIVMLAFAAPQTAWAAALCDPQSSLAVEDGSQVATGIDHCALCALATDGDVRQQTYHAEVEDLRAASAISPREVRRVSGASAPPVRAPPISFRT